MGLSDFPCSFIIGFCPWTSRYVPSSLLLGRTRDLPVPVRDVSLRAQGLRPRGTPLHLALTMRRMLPSAWHHGVGVPESRMFRGSMPWPAFPLSTLLYPPYGWPRMTRGRCGSLLLHRTTLSFASSRRFFPAHDAPSFRAFGFSDGVVSTCSVPLLTRWRFCSGF